VWDFYTILFPFMEAPITNETVISLLEGLGIDTAHTSHSLKILAETNSRYLKDIKLNVFTTLGSNNLAKKEAYLIALATAVNEKHQILIAAFENLAKKEGATLDEIAETHGCASLLSLNNVFYRFRHFMHDVEYYSKQPAGLRMSIMLNPVMGKGFFELMSLVLSALNGCELCVVAHEQSVKEHGATEARIYDAIRLGAAIKGLCVVI
jgi:alkyl hydroperoxide reductase subunit D